ncbi:MAG: hypothetical protein KGZ61_05170 [Sandarakinorhabdus sp.]|nr:hypothetical protein [Sandarakinorhabdus sp.]
MSRLGILDAQGELIAVVVSAAGEDTSHGVVDVPEGYPDSLDWAAGAFVPRVPRLAPRAIYDLFTLEEKAAIHGSFYPQVYGLVSALMWAREPIAVNSSFYQQGVALLAGLGLLAPERVPVVLAGAPPEVQP